MTPFLVKCQSVGRTILLQCLSNSFAAKLQDLTNVPRALKVKYSVSAVTKKVSTTYYRTEKIYFIHAKISPKLTVFTKQQLLVFGVHETAAFLLVPVKNKLSKSTLNI